MLDISTISEQIITNQNSKDGYHCIGFTEKYYTLWYIRLDEVCITDSYGKHWIVGYDKKYTYIKNISFELETAKSKYPGLKIDPELKGLNSSFQKSYEEDLCPQIMKFGKYRGHDLNEVVTKDFNYILWLCENSYSQNAKFAKNLDAIKNHYQSILDAQNLEKSQRENIFNEIAQKCYFEFVPEKNISLSILEYDINGNGIQYGVLHYAIDDYQSMSFIFENDKYDVYEYNGYLYGLPLIKGKAKKIKGKSIKINFHVDSNKKYGNYCLIADSISFV
jgi:hypothetical protein